MFSFDLECRRCFDDLQEAIEANTFALKTSGGDYSLKKEENKYLLLMFLLKVMLGLLILKIGQIVLRLFLLKKAF